MWTCEMPNDETGTARNWMALYMCIVSKSQITAGRALVDMGIISKVDKSSKNIPDTHKKKKIFTDEENEELMRLLSSGYPIKELAVNLHTTKKAIEMRMLRYRKKKGMC